MDFLRQQWIQIQERLAGLSASQRMLVISLVLITVMTMLYWGRYASSREMVALGSAPMSAEELQAAQQSLQAKGIAFTLNGNTIMVPADDQMSALSSITFNQAITSPNFFESMFEKVSAFGTAGDYKARLNNARERTLSAMIQGWPDVKTASVLINDPQQSGIGRFEPRATVSIATRSSMDTKKLAHAANSLVLNSVSGLKRENITVLVDSRSFNASTDSLAGAGNDAMDLIRAFEENMKAKISNGFSFIPSVVVVVTADVETQTKREVIHKVEPTNKLVLPSKSVSETMTESQSPASAEPGLIANGQVDAAVNTPMPMDGSSSEKTTEENVTDWGKSDTEISTPAGKARIVGATVRVPRSYFVSLWRVRSGKPAGEPTEAEYNAIAEQEITSMRGEVRRITAITDEANISVAEFPDLDGLANLMNPGKADTRSADLSLMASSYAKETAIGVLALASLFMVSRIVKKSVPAPVVAMAGMGSISLGGSVGATGSGSGGKSRGSSTLAGDEYIAGEVAEGGAVLMGHELDPATLETAQMVEQVSSYVKQNPDTAATLIRRLMSHE